MKKTHREQKSWNSPDTILVKIGMTTKKNVALRLQEWEKTCQHPVINLSPERVRNLLSGREEFMNNDKSDVKTLTKWMKKLSLHKKDSKKVKISAEGPIKRQPEILQTYKYGGFFHDGTGHTSLQEIENSIHRLLWKQYGKGLVYCYGCDPTGQRRHTEWFNIPIQKLPYVLHTIDSFCLSQNEMVNR
ncbi:uncharacterized protein NDAI_0B03090 [Naumovozyma dairenensis CBS 421]|uniref:DUF1766-domain-containing protein n=1 Tax=Naumovozyma dairenensis (strain ATCC 10597 / BCRC 20456 / CBS 421 / NBRC 0211 / NRRL Y-12639) TaxID=1071378 RepID=G0W6D3_NAUDC|nr:hypothetical protein NDAI_0B03090 [Naumovozyma dairenensis CBS 421]CCD23344.1 hypothetical protein NDAI_0B03090 [Naumovozyma dairenensis CBS 421]